MLHKTGLIFLTFGVMVNTVSAQNLSENFYIKILNEELQRNIQRLRLPDLEKPFFITYNLRNHFFYNLTAERGAITSMKNTPVQDKSASVKLRVGNYHRNFDYMMNDGSFINLPDENDADEYKRLLWLETDRVYKNNSRQYSGFLSSLKRVNVDKAELDLDDLSKITPVVHDFGSAEPMPANMKEWEKKLKSWSALFNPFPDITESLCRLDASYYEDYTVSSEGAMIRKPGGNITLSVYGATIGEDGSRYNKQYSITVKKLEELPPDEVIRSEIEKLISTIQEKRKAKSFKGSYMGPVLFTGKAVSDIVRYSFLNALQVKRKSVMEYAFQETDYEEKMGQKLVASELSLMAIPSLHSFNGKKTTGYYEIDHEGVKPPDSLSLIQNGILKSLLNGRTPTKTFPASQGFAQSFMGKGYGPGVIRLSSSKMATSDSMKSKLLHIAREEGLPCAYIVTIMDPNNTEVYEIDVKTGRVTMIKDCTIAPVDMKSLRRFITASQEMQLNNSASLSIISPQSIIINEIEIEKPNSASRPRPIIVSNPLLKRVAKKK